MRLKKKNINRRSFFKKAAALAGVWALFPTDRQGMGKGDDTVETGKKKGRAYRLTAHIKKYYQTVSQ